jgi:glycosyltransferase involved in cell wall biosynthesis
LNIVFIANQSFAFADPDFEAKGVGGSEYALILLTRTLAKRGHEVQVFGRDLREGAFNGVQYVNISKFDPLGTYEYLILFRSSFFGFIVAKARQKVFWSTDIDWADWDKFIFSYVQKVICISPFHRDFLLKTYKSVREEQLTIMEHGVIDEDYFDSPPEELPKKVGNRLIYCSVPERGLVHLSRLFPHIRQQVPDAELVVTSDYSLWGRSPGTEQFKQMFGNAAGVLYFGKVTRQKLVELQKSSKVMAYPCTYYEGFCIAALECIAAAAVPVTTNKFALATTVGSSGMLVDGEAGEIEYDDAFIRNVVKLLTAQDCWTDLAIKGRRRTFEQFCWGTICDKFERILLT